MHTFCIHFVHIDSSCADFMHTDSVPCRLFADLVHTLRKVNVSHLNAPGRSGPRGGASALLGEVAAAGEGVAALLGEAAAAAAATFEDKAQRSVRRRASGTAAAGCKPVPGEEGCHARAGRGERALGRGNKGLGGTGTGSRCASKQEGPAREPGPACGMGKCERASGPGRQACWRGLGGKAHLGRAPLRAS